MFWTLHTHMHARTHVGGRRRGVGSIKTGICPILFSFSFPFIFILVWDILGIFGMILEVKLLVWMWKESKEAVGELLFVLWCVDGHGDWEDKGGLARGFPWWAAQAQSGGVMCRSQGG